ncbi:hypothetical protein CspHIS471_0601290 [Cutaneotrichosporon sp. HIS471]|nr:hypothetical protein CspHIS471_0601290 [Cutaneotrichosporon sp. HIS471]
MVVWAALAATFVASAFALTPNITAEWEITAMSPMIRFDPPEVWLDTYSNFDDNLYEQGVIGVGYPMLLAEPGARASISYVGTNMTWVAVMPVGANSAVVSPQVDGTAQPGPYMDNVSGAERVVRWASNPEIPFGAHTASFGLAAKAPNKTQVNLMGGIITMPVVGRGLPPSTTVLRVDGTVGSEYGRYTVQLDPPLHIPVNETFDSYRGYTAVNQTMYLTALDPEIRYTVTITGDEDPAQLLGLTSLWSCFLQDPQFVLDDLGLGNGSTSNGTGEVVSPGSNTTQALPGSSADHSGFTDRKKTNVGVIAGGVVGGVLGAGLLAAIIFFLYRRQKKKNDETLEEFVVDATDQAVTSYAQNYSVYDPSVYAPEETQGLMSTLGPSEPRASQGYYYSMQEKRSHPQSLYGDSNGPLNQETAQALLLALQKHQSNVQSNVGSQEQDAGPMGTVPPSYNPEWVPLESDSSGAGPPGLSPPPSAPPSDENGVNLGYYPPNK